MKVWIVHIEWERSLDGSNSEVWGAYSTLAAAKEAQQEAIAEYTDYGQVPYTDPTGDENDNWDFDVHISEQEVE